jgi:putative ABC transport system permease protein
MFKTNPSRTWLTILGMGVGIGAVVILVGLGFGLQNILMEQIVFGETLLSLNVTNPSSKAVVLNEKMVEELGNIPNVKDVSPLAQMSALITFEKLTSNGSLQGVMPSYFKYAGISTVKGKAFSEEGEKETSSILLSTAALKLFGVDVEQAVGKKVTFRVFVQQPDSTEVKEVPIEKEYTISGVVEDPFSISAFILLDEITSRFAIPYFERAQVRVEDTQFLDAATKEVVAKGFMVTAFSKTVEQANKIFRGIQVVLALFGSIALIVSSIGMFNTMTVTLLERTGEIGIMRTIGGSPNTIKVLFISESILMGFLGGMMGILIGVVFGFGVNFLLNSVAARFGGVKMNLFDFPLVFLLFIASFSAIVGFLTGVFPARRAASLSPLDAIRYK